MIALRLIISLIRWLRYTYAREKNPRWLGVDIRPCKVESSHEVSSPVYILMVVIGPRQTLWD